MCYYSLRTVLPKANREFKVRREFRARLVRRDRKAIPEKPDLKVLREFRVRKEPPEKPDRRDHRENRGFKVPKVIPGHKARRVNLEFKVRKVTPEKPGLKVLRESRARLVRRVPKETGANRDRLAKPWWSVPWNMELPRPGHWQ